MDAREHSRGPPGLFAGADDALFGHDKRRSGIAVRGIPSLRRDSMLIASPSLVNVRKDMRNRDIHSYWPM